MAEIRNIHGQGRYIDGNTIGEVLVDFGEPWHGRFVRFRVQASENKREIVLHVDGEMCAYFNDAPSLLLVVNGVRVLDSSEEELPQPLE